MSQKSTEKITEPKDNVKELKKILKKTSLTSFLLSESNDRDTIYQKSKELTFSEKTHLLTSFSTYPGNLLYDAGNVFGAKIWIDDGHSNISLHKPLAYIEHTDDYTSFIEVVDIFESLKKNASLVGHPVIVTAIQYWQKILTWESYIKEDNVYSKTDIGKELNWYYTKSRIKRAKQNLESIGRSLLKGAVSKSIPKEWAFVQKIKELKVESKNNFLFLAWERLASKHITQYHVLEERIQKIEDYLTNLISSQDQDNELNFMDSPINIPMVIDFLNTDGSKFVYDEDPQKKLRPQWRVFVNSFIYWYFQKKDVTSKQYNIIGKQQKIDESPFYPTFLALPSSPNTFILMNDLFNTPLQYYCAPFKCSPGLVGSREFYKLIDQNRKK
jgi:hypothetical protein